MKTKELMEWLNKQNSESNVEFWNESKEDFEDLESGYVRITLCMEE